MFRPQCISAQFQTSHLSHYLLAAWACACVKCMSVRMPLSAPVPVRLFVHVSMHVCLRVYVCVSIAEIAASMRELHMIIEMSVMALGVFDFGAGSCVCVMC